MYFYWNSATVSQIIAEDIRCLHFRLLIGTDSCCLPLESLRILKIPEANDYHLTFPANWRACICLGLKIISAAIMNYAVSASITKTSLQEKFFKFWEAYETIFHPQNSREGETTAVYLLLHCCLLYMHLCFNWMVLALSSLPLKTMLFCKHTVSLVSGYLFGHVCNPKPLPKSRLRDSFSTWHHQVGY